MSIHQQLYDAAKARKLRLFGQSLPRRVRMAPPVLKKPEAAPTPVCPVSVCPVETLAPAITAKSIIRIVSTLSNIPVYAIEGPSRRVPICQSRQLCMHLMRKFTKLSLAQIGQRLGGRDHSTIVHGLHKVSDFPQNFEPLLSDICKILAADTYSEPVESSMPITKGDERRV